MMRLASPSRKAQQISQATYACEGPWLVVVMLHAQHHSAQSDSSDLVQANLMQIVNADEQAPASSMLSTHALLDISVMPMPDGPPIEVINSFSAAPSACRHTLLRSSALSGQARDACNNQPSSGKHGTK